MINMGLKFIISICLIGIIIIGFTNDSYTVELTGRLKRKPGNSYHEIGHITVFVKGGNQVLGKAISNSKGVFHLSWNDNNAKSFYFYCILGKDTLLLAKISKFESDTPDLTFILPDQVPQKKQI
jgi:hypothetical protein